MRHYILSVMLVAFASPAFATSATFAQMRDAVQTNLGDGFEGNNNDGMPCSVQVEYNSKDLTVSMKGYRSGPTYDFLTFTASTESDELVVSDQSYSSKLIYLTAGEYVQTVPKKKIDRRLITISGSRVSLEYKSKHNPSGSTRGLGCYR